MIGEKAAIEITTRALWMLESYISIALIPKNYGTKTQFHRLSIHIIDSIGNNPGINVTWLAQKHGISKSAVSQVVRSLENHGLIERYKGPNNQKEILFRLLDEGIKAFEAHQAYHHILEESTVNELAKFTEDEAKAAEKFISVFEKRSTYIHEFLERSKNNK